jgi:deoxyribose-phosphate aldolase
MGLTKVFETQEAVAAGATEIDRVINIGEFRSGHADMVRNEIRAVVNAAHPTAIVKVILENAYLTHAEKVLGCQLVEEAGADFVKTSTGFAPTGATVEDIALTRDRGIAGAGESRARGAHARSTAGDDRCGRHPIGRYGDRSHPRRIPTTLRGLGYG